MRVYQFRHLGLDCDFLHRFAHSHANDHGYYPAMIGDPCSEGTE